MELSWEHIPILLLAIIVIKDILLIGLFKLNFKTGIVGDKGETEWPRVSILLSVRNEEKVIERCLDGLKRLDYQGEWEVLIGNDLSEDNTLSILRDHEQSWPPLRVFDIEKLVVEKPGKMNVLAQLAEESIGDYLFFTDADTCVPRNWLKTAVLQFKSNIGTLTGVTYLGSNRTFHRLQNIDWIHSISMLKVVHDTGVNVTAIGNNMVIARDAYDAVGGYTGIPFSITEDYKIYHSICKKGYKSFHMFESSMLSQSLPQSSFWNLITQRKRWMSGAFQLPIPMLALLILNAIYFPVLVSVLIINWQIGLVLAFSRWLIKSVYMFISFKKLSLPLKSQDLVLFEFYSWTVDLITFFVFVLPLKTSWKGRKY